MSDQKPCTKCGEVLSLQCFYCDRSSSSGRMSRCISCIRRDYRLRIGPRIARVCQDCGDVSTRLVIKSANVRKQNHNLCQKCALKRWHLDTYGFESNASSRFGLGEMIGNWERGARDRGLIWSVTKDDLDNLYEKQNGLCALTGQLMSRQSNDPCKCSLDRIDSALGYTPDNIQFVCAAVNRMKWAYSQDFFVDICHQVASHLPRPIIPPEPRVSPTAEPCPDQAVTL